MQLKGKTKVKHLIEVFVDDVGFEGIKEKVSNPLKGLRVAPYYGCQLLRPRKNGEEIEDPQFFEELLSAMGAEPVDYRTKTHCCGGSLIITNRKAALHMVHELLLDAANRDTDVIATICPMCNINLEVYQRQVNREYGTNFSIPNNVFHPAPGIGLGSCSETPWYWQGISIYVAVIVHFSRLSL